MTMIQDSLARIRPRTRSVMAGALRTLGWAIVAMFAPNEQRRAIAQLQSLSDLQLRDLGITRAEIEPAVRGARWHDVR
jgi:uncharacterized protein YjiS (DUF1127 family)